MRLRQFIIITSGTLASVVSVLMVLNGQAAAKEAVGFFQVNKGGDDLISLDDQIYKIRDSVDLDIGLVQQKRYEAEMIHLFKNRSSIGATQALRNDQFLPRPSRTETIDYTKYNSNSHNRDDKLAVRNPSDADTVIYRFPIETITSVYKETKESRDSIGSHDAVSLRYTAGQNYKYNKRSRSSPRALPAYETANSLSYYHDNEDGVVTFDRGSVIVAQVVRLLMLLNSYTEQIAEQTHEIISNFMCGLKRDKDTLKKYLMSAALSLASRKSFTTSAVVAYHEQTQLEMRSVDHISLIEAFGQYVILMAYAYPASVLLLVFACVMYMM
ncbi:hypothetical protein V1511DRAFT_511109 [Dipodascopsis uninucleata]